MYDDEFCLSRYRALQGAQPDLFENPAGCPTEILFDPDSIRRAQASVAAERGAVEISAMDLRVGVLAEDQYIGYVMRDAVKFSDGRLGLYNRVVASGGVAVLPILADAIALIRIFRHPARRWFLEAPQGFVPEGDDPAVEAHRELREEIGAEVTELVPLGVVYTSTALTSENIKMFAARISGTGKPQRSEGIESIRRIAVEDIDRLLVDGTICDGLTTSLIAQARLRDLL